MLLIIKENPEKVANWVAEHLIQKMNTLLAQGKEYIVLGLPTGSTPIALYKKLIALHSAGKISFRRVITFNMDEYVGIPKSHPESYHSFMWKHLFSSVDIPPENINFLDGNAMNLEKECKRYEQKMQDVGGIDIFLAGIGEDGHIAFNEPGSSLSSRTRDKNLHFDTIVANSRFFANDITKVPQKALTVGVGTIMDAREVVAIATGYRKSLALHKIVEEGVNHFWTASMLQLHRQCIIVCDQDATMELKVGTVRYFQDIEMEADATTQFRHRVMT